MRIENGPIYFVQPVTIGGSEYETPEYEAMLLHLRHVSNIQLSHFSFTQ